MEKYMIVVNYDGETKVYTCDYSESVSVTCEMLRDLDHPYEVYLYDPDEGYRRTTSWPAKI